MTKNKNEVGMSAEPVVPGTEWQIAKTPTSGSWMVLLMQPDERLGSVPTGRSVGMFEAHERHLAEAVRDALNGAALPAPEPPEKT